MSKGSQRGFGLAPDVEMQKRPGWSAKQLMVSMADSHSMVTAGAPGILMLTSGTPSG